MGEKPDINVPGQGDPAAQEQFRSNVAGCFDALTAWKNASFLYNEMKAKYKCKYAQAYSEQAGSEAAKKTMAEAAISEEKKALDDQKVFADAAYYEMQINFIIAGRQFVGVAFK